jgi:putative transcriptional regulator
MSPTHPRPANRLRGYREAARLTQQQLADRVGAGRSTIIRAEQGTQSPTLELADRIADALDTTIDELFTNRRVESDAPPAKQQPNEARRRMHRAARERAAARRRGDPAAFWTVCFEISKLISFLEGVDVAELELDEHNLDRLDDLYGDLLRLQDFQIRVMGAVQARLGEQKTREKIQALRSKTVANGCTAEEAELSQRIADRLERKLAQTLTASRDHA